MSKGLDETDYSAPPVVDAFVGKYTCKKQEHKHKAWPEPGRLFISFLSLLVIWFVSYSVGGLFFCF